MVVDVDFLSLLRRGVAVVLPRRLAVLSPLLSVGVALSGRLPSTNKCLGVGGVQNHQLQAHPERESTSGWGSVATLGGYGLVVASSWSTLVGWGGGGGGWDVVFFRHGGG